MSVTRERETLDEWRWWFIRTPRRPRRPVPTVVAIDRRAAAVAMLLRHVLGGAKAMRDRDTPEAIRSQLAARDAAVSAGLPQIAVRMEQMLAAYLERRRHDEPEQG
jgi:hypothetical protein